MSLAFPLWHALQPLSPDIIVIVDAHNLMASQLWDLSCSRQCFWCAFEAGKLFETSTWREKKSCLERIVLWCSFISVFHVSTQDSFPLHFSMHTNYDIRQTQHNSQLDFFPLAINMGDFPRLPSAYIAFGLFIFAGLWNDPVIIDNSNTPPQWRSEAGGYRDRRTHLLLHLLWCSCSYARTLWHHCSLFTFFSPFYTIS